MNNTYTLAIRNADPKAYNPFVPAQGIPQNLTKDQAEKLASKARVSGLDVVAFNMKAA